MSDPKVLSPEEQQVEDARVALEKAQQDLYKANEEKRKREYEEKRRIEREEEKKRDQVFIDKRNALAKKMVNALVSIGLKDAGFDPKQGWHGNYTYADNGGFKLFSPKPDQWIPVYLRFKDLNTVVLSHPDHYAHGRNSHPRDIKHSYKVLKATGEFDYDKIAKETLDQVSYFLDRDADENKAKNNRKASRAAVLDLMRKWKVTNSNKKISISAGEDTDCSITITLSPFKVTTLEQADYLLEFLQEHNLFEQQDPADVKKDLESYIKYGDLS